MKSRVKLLYWFIRDTLVPSQPDSAVVSPQRVNREVIDHEKSIAELHDDASIKCIARVKRRMLLGTLCPDPPRFAGSRVTPSKLGNRPEDCAHAGSGALINDLSSRRGPQPK